MSAATALAFDVGARRIGVAVGNTISNSARELCVMMVNANGPDWAVFDRVIRQWKPDMLVIGDPLNIDGDNTAMQPARKRAHQFAEQAQQRSGLPVSLIDERRSSIEAAQRFAEQRQVGAKRRRDAQALDAMAAVIILERWLHHPDSRTALHPT